MKLKNKIIMGIILFILLGFAVMPYEIANGTTVRLGECFAAFESVIIEKKVLCFESKQAYDKYKKEILGKYNKNGNNLWLWTDGEREEFLAVLKKEVAKQRFNNLKNFDDLMFQLKK